MSLVPRGPISGMAGMTNRIDLNTKAKIRTCHRRLLHAGIGGKFFTNKRNEKDFKRSDAMRVNEFNTL